jgi:subtilisin
MQTISAKAVDSSRPKYLIVFSEAEEKNTSTLSTVLKRGKAKDVPERSGIRMLAAGETGVHVKVYEKLGVAAADLNKSQYNALCKRDDVVAVVENEIRLLPPVRRTIEDEDGTPSVKEEKAQMVDYLTGVRDLANLMLSRLEGGNAPSPQAGAVAQLAAASPAAVRFTWGLKAIGVATALSPPTGKGVKVAVLDTGLDLEHPDFEGRVAEGETARSFSGVSVQDVHGHGTHCAGIIGGPRQSVSGTRYGVAPDVSLLVGKVFNNDFRPKAADDDILEGITWADEHGARIISMSLGSIRDLNGDFAPLYEQMAKKLLKRTSNSVILIAAAGNESDRPASTAPVGNPAACPSVMAVAAVDKNKRVASFSCRQLDDIGTLDVSAPGVAIFSSFTNGEFETLDGTSMATPFVAGLAALYLQRDPKLTAQKLFDELVGRAKKLGDPDDFGAGLVQL